MEHVGIDVHKNQSQICIITSEGEMIEKRVSTERARFGTALSSHPGARILIESSTESEWVAVSSVSVNSRAGLTPRSKR